MPPKATKRTRPYNPETHNDPSKHWTRTTQTQINGRHVTPGTELTVSGQRGRFRFLEHVTTEQGIEWLWVIGGAKGYETFRAFRPEAVKRVHYKQKTRHNAEES